MGGRWGGPVGKGAAMSLPSIEEARQAPDSLRIALKDEIFKAFVSGRLVDLGECPTCSPPNRGKCPGCGRSNAYAYNLAGCTHNGCHLFKECDCFGSGLDPDLIERAVRAHTSAYDEVAYTDEEWERMKASWDEQNGEGSWEFDIVRPVVAVLSVLKGTE